MWRTKKKSQFSADYMQADNKKEINWKKLNHIIKNYVKSSQLPFYIRILLFYKALVEWSTKIICLKA